MKAKYVLATVAITIFALVPRISAQSTVIEFPQPKSLVIDLMLHPESPLRITVAKPGTASPSPVIELTSIDERAIRGYTMIIDKDGSKFISINACQEQRLIEKASSQTHYLDGLVAEKRIAVSIDYVLFADGTSWGGDKTGASAIISAFSQGRDLALKRLTAMLTETSLDADEIFKPVRASGGFRLGGPLNLKFDRDRYRLEGYRSVIRALRSPYKFVAESQDLARKLELVENSLAQ